MDADSFRAAAMLAEWREQRAIERDLPRGWVLTDAAIYEIAQARPRTREELSRIASVPPGTVSRAGDAILAAIRNERAPATVAGRVDDDPGRPGPEEVRRRNRSATPAVGRGGTLPSSGMSRRAGTRGLVAARANFRADLASFGDGEPLLEALRDCLFLVV